MKALTFLFMFQIVNFNVPYQALIYAKKIRVRIRIWIWFVAPLPMWQGA